MPNYIETRLLVPWLKERGMFDVLEYINSLPPADVVPRYEVDDIIKATKDIWHSGSEG